MFSLVKEPWLPAVNKAGQHQKISPLQLADDDIIDLTYPRADFQGAAYQFLIGMLQTTYAPEDEEEWEEIWNKGFDTQLWPQALALIECAMQFGPEKPAFLQDFATLETDNSPISGLFIDSPGGNTLKLNKDHFVKRSYYQHICPHCAAMALFTVQTNSPAAGAGFRTSMRGGGPMTTLVMPQNADRPLWQKLWLNIIPQEKRPTAADLPLIFPWLVATRSSEKAGNSVTPENSHPLQAYWGIPRRVEIDFSQTEAGHCDICGEENAALLTQIRNKNYGVQYEGWIHPLSPYRQALKEGSPLLALKGQPGGLAYKDWLGLVLGGEDKFNRTLPAKVVQEQIITGCRVREKTGLWCFGYDMDNAKARCWYQHRLPLLVATTADAPVLVETIELVVSLASGGLSLLRLALKEAWFNTPKEAKGDFSAVDIAYWQETEGYFRTLLPYLVQDPHRQLPQTCDALLRWSTALYQHIFGMFDAKTLANPDSASELLRVLSARRRLDKEYNKQNVLKELKSLMVISKEVQDA